MKTIFRCRSLCYQSGGTEFLWKAVLNGDSMPTYAIDAAAYSTAACRNARCALLGCVIGVWDPGVHDIRFSPNVS